MVYAMAGKPKPTQLKIITGNPGRRPLPENEPKPSRCKTLRAPKELTPAAKTQWRKVAKQLDDAGILTEVDTEALVLYCEAYARWRAAQAQIDKYGLVVKSRNGFPTQSPYVPIVHEAFRQMRQLLTDFGMTPSSRTKVQSVRTEDTVDDPWADL